MVLPTLLLTLMISMLCAVAFSASPAEPRSPGEAVPYSTRPKPMTLASQEMAALSVQAVWRRSLGIRVPVHVHHRTRINGYPALLRAERSAL